MRNDHDCRAGKVIVTFKKDFDFANATAYETSRILGEIPYEKIEVVYRCKGGVILSQLTLKENSRFAVMEAIEKLSKNPYVEYAEPDFLEDSHIIPNDPLFDQLWGLKKIGAPLAWDYSKGSANVSVGIIDSGIDHNHPDIKANMWSSIGGQILDGWNFADNSRDSMDINGHGTHVAGTIGAVGNNSLGITGEAWSVRVVSMRFGFNIASAIAAIDFANVFEIPIINASWGKRTFSQSLKFAIDNYNGLFIASAGNDGIDNDADPTYPASYDSKNIISVAASTPDDELAAFSNYGAKTVHIAAPGTNILSLGLRDGYSVQNGTSMSAPHVAGAAALLKSHMPDMSALDIKNAILSSAVKHPSLTGKMVTEGILNINRMFEVAKNM
ncbi:MAG: S8 family serine peptidase [Defluviitaleaceae bacterium]|nr:S8 family serine peptidase [Defluviitaleaceae bacterium]